MFSSTGCTLFAPADPERIIESRLNGRGPVFVGADNPFLAANRFLATESKSSPELAGFIKSRGMPQRLQYQRSFLGDPSLVLFYDRTGERFRADRLDGLWVFEVNQEAKLKGSAPTKDPASAALDGKRERQNASFISNAGSDTAKSPGDKITAGAVGAKEEAKLRSRVGASNIAPRLPPLVTKCRELAGIQPAERTPRGDLIHYVIDERETALIIAEWYTGESAPAGTLLRLNKLAENQSLGVGDQLVIPSYLVKNTDQLGSAALRCLLTEKAINSH